MTDWPLLVLLALLACVAVYALYGWRQTAAAKAAGDEAAAAARAKLEQIDSLKSELERERADKQTALADLARERATAEERARAMTEKEAALIAMKQEVEKSFESLANRALSQNEQRFLTLANETFEKHRTVAAGNVKEVVSPVQEQFAKLSETIAKLDKERTEDKSALTEQMRAIGATLQQTQAMTGKLANALRAAPKVRGRWGEETLKNVLELSGLSQRIDFFPEETHEGDEQKLRPDVLIRLPGGRCIVVDSKVALSGYMDAMEATEDHAREDHLVKHAHELGQHARNLGRKEYWRHVPDTADFVVMFVPGENFIAAAFERDPDLYERSLRDRVIIVGPSSLLALARSIAYGWRQEEVAKNAEQIASLGRELYARLAKLSALVGDVGGALDKSVKKYNEMVASLDTRVMVTARKFRELGADEAGAALTEPGPIEAAPRLPAPQGELELPPPPKKRGAG
ncbi:MAG: DNA recombination protein RmuC [Alphaproteobacteria bacterium]|nr:DNA recombination protein RmuC [Alphaproteobacteria bacterium]